MVIGMINWDKIVITAGTEQQKDFILKMVSEIDFLDTKKIFVVCDEQFGCRIGSGGAFINVISRFFVSEQRMLIINAGGFSKRCINYAVKSKLFCTFYYDDKITTLLESLIVQTGKIAHKIKSGAVVCCSDILIDLTGSDFSGFNFDDSIGFCIKSPIEVCSRHGVFIGENGKRVRQYAHKKSVEELKEIIPSDCGLVDTGMLFFSEEFLKNICNIEKENALIDIIEKNQIELNLYPEIVSLLAEEKDKSAYLYDDLQNEIHLKIRQILWDKLSSFHIKIFEIDTEKFLHFGTVSESANNIRYLKSGKNVVQINSIVNNCTIKDKAIFENCYLNNCVIGSNVFVSDIMLTSVNIPDNTLVCGIKTADGKCAAICCPIDENPKDFVNGTELWKTARFSLAETFTESFNNFSKATVSMEQLTQNAVTDYYYDWSVFLKNINYCNASQKYIKRSDEAINNYFCDFKYLDELELKKDFIEIQLPLRLNLSGTWTDALPYCTDNGGQVINMSVKIDNNLPICVSLKKLHEPIIKFISDNKETVYDISNIYSYSDEFDDFILHKSALKVLGITPKTVLKHGFCLKTQVCGIKKGSGLGVSSLLLLGCFTAFEKALDITLSDSQKANMVFISEQVMKTGGGWQDQICGISHGINITTTEKGQNQNVSIRKIPCSAKLHNLINDRFAIVYTGQRHYGRFIVYEIMNKYLENDSKTCNALHNLLELNTPMEKAIIKSDIKEISDLLNKQFSLLKELSGKITNEQIDKLTSEILKFADGVCICGAGAGGYLALILKENVSFEDFQKAIAEKFSDNREITVNRVSLYITDHPHTDFTPCFTATRS